MARGGALHRKKSHCNNNISNRIISAATRRSCFYFVVVSYDAQLGSLDSSCLVSFVSLTKVKCWQRWPRRQSTKSFRCRRRGRCRCHFGSHCHWHTAIDVGVREMASESHLQLGEAQRILGNVNIVNSILAAGRDNNNNMSGSTTTVASVQQQQFDIFNYYFIYAA